MEHGMSQFNNGVRHTMIFSKYRASKCDSGYDSLSSKRAPFFINFL